LFLELGEHTVFVEVFVIGIGDGEFYLVF